MRLKQGDTFASNTFIFSPSGSLLLDAGFGVPAGKWADSPADFHGRPEAEITPIPPRTAEPAAGRDLVDISADWAKSTWQQMRSLAAKLTDKPVKNMDDAVAAIEAELARRD